MPIQEPDLTYSLALLTGFELRPTGAGRGVMALCRRHVDEVNALIVDNASDPPSLADLAIMAAEHEAEHHGGPAMPDRYSTDCRPKPTCPTCESSTRGGMNAGRNAIDRGDGPEWCDDEWHDEAEMAGGGPS